MNRQEKYIFTLVCVCFSLIGIAMFPLVGLIVGALLITRRVLNKSAADKERSDG